MVRTFIKRVRKFLSPSKPIILQVTEESRLFILLRSLNLVDKLNIEYLDPTTGNMRFFRKYYILVKLAQIESLAHADIIASQDLLNQYRKHKKTYLIYDISTEAITFTDYTSHILAAFHEILRVTDISNERVILICSNANAEQSYKAWAAKNGFEDYHIKVLGYHFYLYEYYWEIARCDWLRDNHDALMNSALNTVNNFKRRDKYFICLNLRPRKHRTALVLHLLERGHIHKGHVTYFGDEFAEHESVDKAADRLSFLESLPSKDRLIPFIDKLNSITPLLLDKDASKIKKDLWDRKPGKVEFLIPEGDDLAKNGINSYFEIVTETWLTDQTNSYITEKTIRPIIRLQPFIHIGSPFLLKYLSELGFKTFSPFIDESYDEIDDPVERLEAIFKEIDRLCSMSADEIHKWYCDLYPRLLHNYEHFKNRLIFMAEAEIEKNVLKKIHPNFTFKELSNNE
jgi:hypothetical protein